MRSCILSFALVVTLSACGGAGEEESNTSAPIASVFDNTSWAFCEDVDSDVAAQEAYLACTYLDDTVFSFTYPGQVAFFHGNGDTDSDLVCGSRCISHDLDAKLPLVADGEYSSKSEEKAVINIRHSKNAELFPLCEATFEFDEMFVEDFGKLKITLTNCVEEPTVVSGWAKKYIGNVIP